MQGDFKLIILMLSLIPRLIQVANILPGRLRRFTARNENTLQSE